MSIYKGLSDPTIPVGGPSRIYFVTGKYSVKIDVLKGKSAQESFKGKASFIAELIVTRSSAPSLIPGAVAAWVQTFDARTSRNAFSAMKQFFAAALKLDDLTAAGDLEELASFAISPANPFRGFELDLQCTEKQFKKSDGTPGQFTDHRWLKFGEVWTQV